MEGQKLKSSRNSRRRHGALQRHRVRYVQGRLPVGDVGRLRAAEIRLHRRSAAPLRHRLLEQELLEFSAVPVPANGEALIEGRSAGIDIAPLLDWSEDQIKRAEDPRES
jgi:hypothetical protein